MSLYRDYQETLLLIIKHKKCPYIICGKDCPIYFKQADLCGGKFPFRLQLIVPLRIDNCIKEYTQNFGEESMFDGLL